MKRVFLGREKALFTTLCTLSTASLIGCSIPFISDSGVNDPDQKKSSAQQSEEAPQASSKRWLSSGSLVLSRPAPEVAQSGGTVALGFSPMSQVVTANGMHSGAWLLMDADKGEVVMMRGSAEEKRLRAEGLEGIKKGRYQVLHKQSNPAWHATDAYFTRRGLEVPAEGSPRRFLRGALGSHVIFLDKNTPLHSAPHYSEDVGGVRIDPAALESLFGELEVGSAIEVR